MKEWTKSKAVIAGTGKRKSGKKDEKSGHHQSFVLPGGHESPVFDLWPLEPDVRRGATQGALDDAKEAAVTLTDLRSSGAGQRWNKRWEIKFKKIDDLEKVYNQLDKEKMYYDISLFILLGIHIVFNWRKN